VTYNIKENKFIDVMLENVVFDF